MHTHASTAAIGTLWTRTQRIRARPDHAERLGGHARLAGVSLAATEHELDGFILRGELRVKGELQLT